MNRILSGGILLFLTACGGGGSSGGGSGGAVTGPSAPPANSSTWSIPESEIQDPGPGRNGIPSLNFPQFIAAAQVEMHPNEIVVGVDHRGAARAYPHRILNYWTGWPQN